MFENAKVGDMIWTINRGWVHIVDIRPDIRYPIVVTGGMAYTYDGLKTYGDLLPSAFWTEPKFEIPTRPKRIVTKTIEAYALIKDQGDFDLYWKKHDTPQDKQHPWVKLTGTYEVEE